MTQPPRASFIEEARRRQIVETAIRTIAARGYSQSSLAEIAREAGISKGVISYHFEGKPELVEAILSRLLAEPAEFIKARVDASENAADKLQAIPRPDLSDIYTDPNNVYARRRIPTVGGR